MRWRLRGAWQWPLFAAITVLDAGLLHWLPLAGKGTGWVPGLLLSGCLNLAAIALLGGTGGWLLRRRRPDLPKVVADDYAGTVLLVAVAGVFLAIGLVHRPERDRDRRAFDAQSAAVRRYVANTGDAFARAHVDQADTLTLEPHLFRTCLPTPRPRRFDCMIVNTDSDPPVVRADRSHESNASLNRPGGF